jgi:hypothetical protein
MSDKESGAPSAPDLPNYLVTILKGMSADQLQVVADYANDLAEWKSD